MKKIMIMTVMMTTARHNTANFATNERRGSFNAIMIDQSTGKVHRV